MFIQSKVDRKNVRLPARATLLILQVSVFKFLFGIWNNIYPGNIACRKGFYAALRSILKHMLALKFNHVSLTYLCKHTSPGVLQTSAPPISVHTLTARTAPHLRKKHTLSNNCDKLQVCPSTKIASTTIISNIISKSEPQGFTN